MTYGMMTLPKIKIC